MNYSQSPSTPGAVPTSLQRPPSSARGWPDDDAIDVLCESYARYFRVIGGLALLPLLLGALFGLAQVWIWPAFPGTDIFFVGLMSTGVVAWAWPRLTARLLVRECADIDVDPNFGFWLARYCYCLGGRRFSIANTGAHYAEPIKRLLADSRQR